MMECFSAKSVPILQFRILALRGEFHPHTSSKVQNVKRRAPSSQMSTLKKNIWLEMLINFKEVLKYTFRDGGHRVIIEEKCSWIFKLVPKS